MRFDRRPLFACLVAASITLSPVTGLAGGDPVRASGAAASRISIDNFGQISETYYRGAQPAGDDYAALAALGVKTVIDLQADGIAAEEQFVTASGMQFHRIPMTTRIPPTADQLTRFLELVNDPQNQPVYVHCAGGRHRTGVMTAAYRMTHDGWSPDQAFREMKQFKFGADFLHPEFKRFVYAYRVTPESPEPAAVRASTEATAAN